MGNDAGISALISDMRALQKEARATVAVLDQTKGSLSGGSGLGIASANSTLSGAGALHTSANIPAGFDNIEHAKPRAKERFGLSGDRHMRHGVKLIRGGLDFAQDIISGDPASILSGLSHEFKHLKKLQYVGKVAGVGAIGMFGARAGKMAAEEFGKGEYLGAAADFAGAIAVGAGIGGPAGAAFAAMATALSFAYERMKPTSLEAFLKSPLGSLGGQERNAESAKFEATRATIQAFRSIYGGGPVRKSQIDKMIESGTDLEKIREVASKAGDLIDKGTIQVGLGNFNKGVGLIQQGRGMAAKSGLLDDGHFYSPASLYQMLESQRIAVKNFAAASMSRAGSRTGD